MPNKTEEYLALAQRTVNGLTRYWESWTDYLTTASRLYKYPFADQLMIYAQRPDATACADYDVWNNRMNRYVRRGAKGIALLDESSGFPRLHYVFDVSDTGVRRNSRDPEVWQYNDDLKQPVSEMLSKTYGISGDRVSQQLADVAGKLVADYWDNNGGDIRAIVDGSLLMDYDEAGVEMQFKSAAAISVTYTLLERCGFEPAGWFDKDDLRAIHEFSTPDSVYALGAAVSDMSREALRQIERTVKTTIRRRNAERSQHEYEQQSELHADRGLSSPEPDPVSAEDPAGQVRQDAPELSEAAAPGTVQHDAPEREPVPAPDGGGADGREPDAADHGAASETEPGPGQREPADGVGAAHEQPESAGRGTGADGADLQLSFLDAVLPTEAQQIEAIDRAESEKTPSAFVLSQAEIENELRKHGSGFAGGKQRIMALYQTQPDRKLRAKALAKEYGIGGHSHDFLDGSRGFVNHDWKGLEFDHYPDHQKITLKWAQVEKYIDLMIQSDRYLTDDEKEQRAAIQEAERLLPMLDGTTVEEYRALKEQYPDTLVGFELNGNYLFYDKDAIAVERILHNRLLSQENALGKVKVTGFPRGLWATESKKLWAEGNNIYLAGLNEDGTHHETKHLRAEDYLPIGSIIEMDGRDFRVEHVNFMFKSVGLQDMDSAKNGYPIFRNEHLPHIRELYEEQPDSDRENFIKYMVGDEVIVDLPTRTIEGTIGYVGDTDVRIDTSAHGHSWDNEVINRQQFEEGLRQEEPDEPELTDEELDELPISTVIDGEVQTFPNAAALDEALNTASVPEPAGNFRITDEHLGEGGAKQKYTRNIEAIKTLFRLEEEHRGASAEEQEVLAQYVGWGGLADAFDPNKSNWSEEYAELKGLLSEDEYAAARSSVLNAHYTSPTVIHAIYNAVEQMGFKAGNILEPSMGVGNFFGMLLDTMQASRLYGVELDSITGRIAQKLYPQADITVAGFETTDRRDFYDLAVGNVPFGQYKVNDKAYNKLGFSIHNYFFAKAIDQVRPGGVVAFVTSRYTMDSKDSTARKHMAERADLLGAIRLPNNAFKANAGTDVVSDIIFLQKRDRPIDHEPDWVQLGKTEDGFAINQYFVDHPEMVLGQLTTESTQYGREELTVAPIEGAMLADQLAEAVQHIEGQYTEVEVETPDIADAEAERKTLPADPDVKNFSYAVVDGEVFYRENSIMTQVELSDNAKARVTGMVELRQIVNQLIQEQLDDYPDSAVQETQVRLNDAYDAFSKKYGLLNDRRNARLFEQDSSYYLLCSLENLDEQGQLKSKADMFTKRTIRPERTVTSVDTPSEALAVSMGEHGRVDLPYMAELLGTPGEYERITTELSGVIFKDPSADPTDPEAGWQMADEYLSGDVRAKLRFARLAAETNPEFAVNVDALTKAQPKELEASEIDVRLGATWLAPEIIQKFMQETFQVPYYLRHDVNVRFSPYTAEWRVQGKSALGHGDIMSTETYGTHRANAYKILEDTLNLKDVRIYDTIEDAEGKPKRVLNKNETTLAQQKQQAIKDAFANWIWQDPQRRVSLVRQYNELFNSTRPREYDGSHIHFVGMNPEITLREHQRNAIAHVLYGGNTLLAHEVGAGKTFEMAASAMEAKRLGLCQKSLFVVPNHLTEQWASEFLHLYPNAKLFVARKKDFETANRKKFCARIATGDYDAVIIGHSQFERIPLSFERQERIIQDQIAETLLAINELKANAGENFTIKQMEKTRKTLEAKLDKLRADSRKDDVITFEQLGVDRLFVDESHSFKNLFLTTKMRNVAGLSTSEAQKSSDMFGKCRYLDEITGGRGVVFATGTPVSNSMTELYTVMRYLQYSTLQQKKLTHFDCWASTFGETTTAIELAPEGTGYRARTRFAKFFNLPELMSMFKEVADIKTSDQLHLPVPDAKFETVVVKPSETQKAMVQELSKRAAEIHSGNVDASVDNMLCVTNDGRKIGLDVRLMNPLLPDDPNSKLNICVQNVLKIWEEGKDQKLTQLVFCDLSTPKNDGNFNVYDDIRKKLVAADVPENEVEFIHNADTEAKKAALFSKVRSGDVRILLGSTAKMGAGTNVQQRLVAVHHLDVGWKPSDMTQRNGRIIRQGNMNKEVKVFNYVTEGTFDSYLYQTLENKQRFISQIMTSKSPVRSCDDVDEQALSYAEIKALCAGNPLIKEKMDLDVQVAKLKVLKADHQSQKFRLEDKLLTKFPAEIQEQTAKIAALKSDAEIAAAHPQDKETFCGMVIKGITYDEKKTAGERLILACMELPNTEEQLVGSYRGFELSLRFDTFHKEHQALLKGTLKYPVSLGSDPYGNIVRLDNALNAFADRITAAENELDTLQQQQAAAQIEVEKPFPQEDELAQKSARLAELNAQLDVDEKHHEPEQDEEEQEDAPRRSVLAALEEKAEKAEPVKPFKSYPDKDGDAR
ncbi:N-domain protein, SNF2 family [Faecalibacterium prausnitzii]|uniref:N-domain protein, SNF2 family n=3 Tax=Faecalibacterium prausnitzii TaxID=853 RepID=A0A367FYT0_9FIRM|nr:N-domain protein, SNF2 family [Faecalibacterium prausnitzii]RCH48876.1 N-domain protein, SNF2 family [Faecalibacterium prausnitzii]